MTDNTPDSPRHEPTFTEDRIRRIEEGELLPTPEELAALENAYKMTPLQRKFVRLLYSVEINGTATIPDTLVTEDQRRRVDAHAPYPAALLDRRWDIVYANADYRRVLPGTEAHGANFLTWLFLDGDARSVVIDFAAEARHLIGRFRFTHAAHLDDPAVNDLLEQLTGDEFFATAWDDHAVLADGPAATPMHWLDQDTGKTLRVTEEGVPDSEWLTLQSTTPVP